MNNYPTKLDYIRINSLKSYHLRVDYYVHTTKLEYANKRVQLNICKTTNPK